MRRPSPQSFGKNFHLKSTVKIKLAKRFRYDAGSARQAKLKAKNTRRATRAPTLEDAKEQFAAACLFEPFAPLKIIGTPEI
jgi:hypothetical protein